MAFRLVIIAISFFSCFQFLFAADNNRCDLKLISPCWCQRWSPMKRSIMDDDEPMDKEKHVLNPSASDDKIALKCDSDEEFDLPSIFTRLSKLSEKQRHFKLFNLTSRSIEELTKNLTKAVIFKEIEINAPNLKRIHSEALVGTKDKVEKLTFGKSMKMLEKQKPYNFFDLISSMVNLKFLYIYSPIIDIFSANIFKHSPKLSTIHVDLGMNDSSKSDKSFKMKLENGAFDNIPETIEKTYYFEIEINLILKNAQIDHIPFEVFKSNPKSKEKPMPLTINLSGNKLTSKSFSVGSFVHLNRKTELKLGVNPITYLEEKVFKPFLDANHENILETFDLPLDCKDSRNNWWLNDDSYRKRLWSVESFRVESEKSKDKFIKQCLVNFDARCQLISPCSCEKELLYNELEKTDIVCNSTEHPIDLAKIFRRLENKNNSHLMDKFFNKLSIKSPKIEKINKNAVGENLFVHIEIDAPNLELIHRKAFAGTAQVIKQFEIGSSMKKYQSQEGEFSFFNLINSMVSLESLTIKSPIIDFIPTLAFPMLSKIEIDFGKNVEKVKLKIENRAFYHSLHLCKLQLKNAGIDQITAETFKLNPYSNIIDNKCKAERKIRHHKRPFRGEVPVDLEIDLSGNNLTSTSFSPGCFQKLHRSASLRIDGNLGIKYLDEKVFRPFIFEKVDALGPDNRIFAIDLSLFCDGKNAWWAKDWYLVVRVKGHKCPRIKDPKDDHKEDEEDQGEEGL